MMLTIQAIISILSLLGHVLRESDLDDPLGIPRPQNIEQSYDFIVVGGGSAGCVVAARLSETQASVLLIEAGSGGSPLLDIPIAYQKSYGSSIDWAYLTEPDGKSCLGMKDGKCIWHAGKVIGGGSAINAMLYNRGDQEDFNTWESRGNPGWSWDDVLPFFKKSEDQQNPAFKMNTKYHSVGGPQPVSDLQFTTPLSEAFLQAGHSKGYPIRNLKTGNATGFFLPQTTIKNGQRYSTARSFLNPILEQDNLSILLDTVVSRLLLSTDGYTPRAEGVVFTRHGTEYVVRARREVIVSAGAVGSPKLLMLSGIGPRQHLEQLGIPLTMDLPVGLNMQSHVGTAEVTFTVEDPVSFNPIRLFSNLSNLQAYVAGEEGPLSTINVGGIATYRTGLDASTSWPDILIQYIDITMGYDGGFGLTRAIGATQEMIDKFVPLAGKEGFTMLPMLLHPKSRGTIKLRSKNPSDQAVINANYFDNPADVKTLIAAIRFSIELGNTEYFKRHGAKLYDRPLPYCEAEVPHSDAYWECAIRYLTFPMYHDGCTCPMGPVTDLAAVVSSKLKVHGVDGLRVADASVMPELTSGNTNAVCIMIGEKVAHFIKEDYPTLLCRGLQC